MKTMSTALKNLLATGQFVVADLWTITLAGGLVVRWTGHDQPITVSGNTFLKGPTLDRSTIVEKVGTEVATLDLTIGATNGDLINGVQIIPFIAAHGFDGANIKLERAYASDWGSAIAGTVIRFAGKVTSIKNIQGATADLVVSSWLVLLNVNAPRNLFQVGCDRILYDTNCGVVAASFSQSGTVSGGAAVNAFASGVTNLANYYAQGRVAFTSGVNAGLSRTVRSYDGAGNFALIAPFPNAPSVGDAFTAYAGCDLSMATCNSRFNNLTSFRGFPFVPPPLQSAGTPATTISGGK